MRGRSPYCAKCRRNHFKARYPLKYSYGNLRRRARQRGHEFTLTFEEYAQFAEQTRYARLKGKHKYSLSIHRKDNDKGYSLDNIQAVTLSTNSRLAYAKLPDYMLAEMEADLARSAKLDNEPF